MKLMKFLNGLDDSYNQVKSHIHLMDPLPNVKKLFQSFIMKSHIKRVSIYYLTSFTTYKTHVSSFNSMFSDNVITGLWYQRSFN